MKHFFIITSFIFTIPLAVNAQDAPPSHPLDGSFIKEWLVIGPFSGEMETDFLAAVGGEANINPKEGDTVNLTLQPPSHPHPDPPRGRGGSGGKGEDSPLRPLPSFGGVRGGLRGVGVGREGSGERSKTLTWKRHVAKGNVVASGVTISGGEGMIAYAFCLLDAGAGGEAEIRLGANRFAFWINGTLVYQRLGFGSSDPDQGRFRVNLRAGGNRCLVKLDALWQFAMRGLLLPAGRAILAGTITDAADRPIPDATVRLEQNGHPIQQTASDADGNYQLEVYPAEGNYDLSATSDERGAWRLNLPLRQGERRTVNLRLREAVSIEGKLVMFDDKTPQVSIPVEAVQMLPNQLSNPSPDPSTHPVLRTPLHRRGRRGEIFPPSLPSLEGPGVGRKRAGGLGFPEGQVVATTLSNDAGKYRFVNLLPGRYLVRCQVRGGYVDYPRGPITVQPGKPVKNIDFRLANFKKGKWTSYSTFNGLVDNRLRSICQDKEGFLWFGTGDGVSRYDGNSFVNFTVNKGRGNEVSALYCDSSGTVWLGTFGAPNDGVCRYDGSQNPSALQFVRFTVADGLVGFGCGAIHQDTEGMVWFGTSGGISRYDGKTFVNLTAANGLGDNGINAIYEDADGSLWFGTSGGGVSRYDSKTFLTFTTADGLANNTVQAIVQSPDGAMWFGTRGGVSRFDGERFANYTTTDGLPDYIIEAIHCNPDGVLWFGTMEGLSRFDGKTFVNYTTADGLINNDVQVLYQATDGALWIGTADGVSRFDEQGFANFDIKDGLINDLVRAVHRDAKGRVWFGASGGGVFMHDPSILQVGEESLVTFTTRDGLGHNSVRAIYSDRDGNVWFGTRGGVTRYDGEHLTNLTTKDGLTHDVVNTIYQDASGAMWFGTNGGLSRYERSPAPTSPPSPPHPPLPLQGGEGRGERGGGEGGGKFTSFADYFGVRLGGYNSVWAIYQDSAGHLWFGTRGAGIGRYDGVQFVQFGTEDGLAETDINAIYQEPEGQLWLGMGSQGFSGGGVAQYDGKRFTIFTKSDGLSHNVVQAIHRHPPLAPPFKEGDDGVMYFGTEGGGVSLYNGEAWTSLDMRDGLPSNVVYEIEPDPPLPSPTHPLPLSPTPFSPPVEGNQRGGWGGEWGEVGEGGGRQGGGYLWFGTYSGVTRYRRNSTPPKVQITAVLSSRFTAHRPLVDVPSIIAHTRVTIEYRAIDFKTVVEKRQYRVKISSLAPRGRANEHKSKITKETRFEWIPETPGTYTVEVVAIDRDLNYSEPDRVTLKVLPPWYLNGWIAIPSGGAIAFLIGLSAFLGRRSYRQRREIQRVREQMLEQERQKNVELAQARDAAEVASRAKSTFLANMSHEIRTPMNAVLGYAQILQRDSTLQPHHREAVSTIENSGNHLLALINDILDLSKIEADRVELQSVDFNLTALISELEAMFRIPCQQKGLAWRVEWANEQIGKSANEQMSRSAPEQIWVHGDEGKLKQVLINLLGNAVKFTEAGGVTLRISEVIHQRNGMEGKEGGKDSDFTFHVSRFTFEVIDTGPGIPPEVQAEIFEPFVPGEAGQRAGGTGLGLAITRRHIELMGGELGLESPPHPPAPSPLPSPTPFSPPQEGKGVGEGAPIYRGGEGGIGSRFFFTIPLPLAVEDSPNRLPDRRKMVRLAEGATVKAIVADDVKENRDVLATILRDMGVEVRLAESGQQALELVRPESPDILFIDIRMPEMDGIETLRRIHEELGTERPKLVAISASALTHERQQFLDAGFDDFIPKPFRVEQICECLEKLLHVRFESIEPPDETLKRFRTFSRLEIELPEALLSRLKGAARDHSVTKLLACLDEMALLGEAERLFAAHLRESVRNFEFERIIELLN